MVKISVIIPTRNRAKSLKKALISLQNQDFKSEEFEVLVIDNNSTDNTKEVVQEFNKNGSKKIDYIIEKRIGLHYGRHTGALHAKGEIVAYLDDDVICDSSWLQGIWEPYEDPLVSAVGGKVLPKWEEKPPQWIKKYPMYLSLLDLGDEKKILDIPKLYGCNMSVRKSVIFEVGGFNPDGFGDKKLIWYRGDGETGLLRKILKTDKKIVYNPKALIWHVIPKNRLNLDYFRKRSYIEGISSAFYTHRTEKVSIFRRLYRMLGLFILFIVCKTRAIPYKYAGNDKFYDFDIIAYSYQSASIYEMKLLFDKSLRGHIKKEKWIEDKID